MSMPLPAQIGRYEVLEEIAGGSFSVLYKCRDPETHEVLALKVCQTDDQDVLARFSREAEIAIELDHPNIVRVVDFGVSDEGPYLAEEFLQGRNLNERIDSPESLSSSGRIEILLQIAQGLAYAHGVGVLHRDVTPSNVLVLDDGRVKLIDFGLARLLRSDVRSTRAGSILGTAGYLPPEQVLGEPVDERGDIFSFGVLAYYLLSGKKPFPGQSLKELLKQVVGVDPPPMSEHWPECPKDLETLVGCCLAKKADHRYPSFTDVIVDLASIATELRAGDLQVEEPPRTSESRDEPSEDHGTLPLNEAVNSTANRRLRLLRAQLQHASEAILSLAVPYRWAAGAALVVVLISGSWWSLGRQVDAEEFLAELPATLELAPLRETASLPLAMGPAGRVLVVAQPWGEVVSLTRLDGLGVDLPQERATPLTLSLVEGDYRVELRHPSSQESRICYPMVTESDPVVCRVEFFAIESEEYFRETGWWR